MIRIAITAEALAIERLLPAILRLAGDSTQRG